MSGNAAVDISHFKEGNYRDLRDSAKYHNDPHCPIGKRIPVQYLHPGVSPNRRLCPTCASGGNESTPTLRPV
jgi:hypothetical protein